LTPTTSRCSFPTSKLFFHACFDYRSTIPVTNPRRKPGVASDLFLLPNVGAEIVNGVADRVRAELLRNMKLADLLRPSSTKIPAQKAS
jgi:hypothetical protein